VRTDRAGLTLVELTISVTVMGLTGTVIAGLLFGTLRAYQSGVAQTETCREAAYAMNRMVSYSSRAAFVFVPNGPRNDADVLAVAAGIDTDGDGRIDEDTGNDVTGDGVSGVKGVDDDGDGLVDEGDARDDDERGNLDEETLNGVDDDGDGSIDDDLFADMNKDGKAGIAGFDDDNDGTTDEGSNNDDDEDGLMDEDPAEPIIFYLEGDSLMENHPVYGVTQLASAVEQFRAQYVVDETGYPRLDITLSLSRDPGCEVVFRRTVHLENILQKQGTTVAGWPYAEVEYSLIVKYTGNGWLNQIPLPPYYAGDTVILEAVPGPKGWVFAGWSGDVPAGHESDNPLELLMDGNKTVRATFTK
jgi:hypothetical protein